MKWFSFFLALCLVLPLLLVPAWAQELDQSSMDLDYYTRYKGQGRSLNVYNWGEYISDGSDDSLDVNKAFEELTGIKVVYSTFDTNESLYAKLKTAGRQQPKIPHFFGNHQIHKRNHREKHQKIN